MKMRKMHGIVCANITPMNNDGEIDLNSLRKLVNHMADAGIHSVYPTGTNGEGLLLSMEEQHAVAKTVVEVNQGRMDTFIQCTTMRWSDTMENIRYACKIGADGVGVMTPIFYKADDVSMVEYYREACQAAEDKPLYIYNISKYTSNDVSVKAFGEIIDTNSNAIGIKYSNSDIARIQDYLRAPKKRRAEALIGSDSLILSALAAGCVGAVSGPACVFPRRYVGVYEAFIRGDMKLALEMQNRIVACSRSIKAVPQIPAIKAMLKMQGIIETDTCRKPFRKLTIEEYRILEAALNDYNKESF
ncbi:MAG: dihydrodipicolinate synthase family protein [Clostridiaceae bacterium]|nr:dihydrodipicolinate synthase family protein [Clostridiaceae bacterium]